MSGGWRGRARARGLAWTVAAALAGGLGGAAAAGAPPDAVAKPAGAPVLEVIRLGATDVVDRRQIDLAAPAADLAGRAWNFGPGDAVSALIRRLGQGPWTRAGDAAVPPGGLFQITGVGFPDAGSYELIVCLTHAQDLPAGAAAVTGCGPRALAASRALLVRVGARPPFGGESPTLQVLQMGGVPLDPGGVTPVPPNGEVVVRAENLKEGTRVYLAILAPLSDRCYVQGPARPGPQEGIFTLPGVTLEVGGDPRTARLELVAVASPEVLGGPMSLRALRLRAALTSLSLAAEVIVDQRAEGGNSQRVPQLTITRIGDHAPPVDGGGAAAEAELGDAVEVGQYERVPEGERLWVLTRPRGSSLWLAQGPAVLRGGRSPGDPRLGPPVVTWVWPSTRFERPGERSGPVRRSARREQFEVLAVLATATLPEGWVDSAVLSGNFIQSVSQLVRVSMPPRELPAAPRLSITRVGRREADPEEETPVGAAEQVEATSDGALPPATRLYVARHKDGESLWTLEEAMSHGRTHLVPAVSFINPHPQQGARYQLLAIATRGVLPFGQLAYDELVHAAIASSEVITVRYEPGGETGSGAPAPGPTAAPGDGAETGERSRKMEVQRAGGPWMLIAVALVVVALLALLVLAALVAVERRLGVVSTLARSGADRIARGRERSGAMWLEPRKVHPVNLLLGAAILGFVLFALVRYYLPLYGTAVAEITGLPAKKSAGLAIWLFGFTALSGVFLELSLEPAAAAEGVAETQRRRPGGLWIPFFLGLALLILMGFQAAFYFEFLRRTAGDQIGLLGGIAFFLIAFLEAMAFFFSVRLLREPAGWLSRLVRLPLILIELCLRSVAKVFDSITKRRRGDPPGGG